MVETIHPSVRPDRALALAGPPAMSLPGSDPFVGQVLIDVHVGVAYREDPLPFDT